MHGGGACPAPWRGREGGGGGGGGAEGGGISGVVGSVKPGNAPGGPALPSPRAVLAPRPSVRTPCPPGPTGDQQLPSVGCPWSLFMSLSLLTHRLVFLCVDAYCFIFWDLPGDVLAAPESALCGWIGVIPLVLPCLSVCPDASLAELLPVRGVWSWFPYCSWPCCEVLLSSGVRSGDVLPAPASALCGWNGVILLSLC